MLGREQRIEVDGPCTVVAVGVPGGWDQIQKPRAPPDIDIPVALRITCVLLLAPLRLL